MQLLPSGELLFLGRSDEQIKIRGYRIEPQEIISAINAHPAMQDSIITVGEDAANEKCMIAYVGHRKSDLTRSELTEFLNSHLPEYMVPAGNRPHGFAAGHREWKSGSLGAPALPRRRTCFPIDVYFLPNSAIVEKIAAIVCDLLGIARIGIDENFFLLGGHSLLGTQVIAKIRDAFGVELPLRTIFEQPTIAGLSSKWSNFAGALDAMSDRDAKLLFDESCVSTNPPLHSLTNRSHCDSQRCNRTQTNSASITCLIRRCWPILIRSTKKCAKPIPVHWDPFLHAWVVTRYEDVLRVLLQFSADRTPTPEQLTAMDLAQMNPIAQVMVKQMLFMDAPAHTRLRTLASAAFTPARVEVLRQHIQEIADNLLDTVIAQGEVDVIADFACTAARHRHRRDARRSCLGSPAAQRLVCGFR